MMRAPELIHTPTSVASQAFRRNPSSIRLKRDCESLRLTPIVDVLMQIERCFPRNLQHSLTVPSPACIGLAFSLLTKNMIEAMIKRDLCKAETAFSLGKELSERIGLLKRPLLGANYARVYLKSGSVIEFAAAIGIGSALIERVVRTGEARKSVLAGRACAGRQAKAERALANGSASPQS